MNARALVAAFLLVAGSAVPAWAQSLTFQPKNSDQPIVVDAESGIEVQQDTKRVIARGNARAAQGEVSIVGDELIAQYRTNPDGSNEVYRVFAAGNVTMRSTDETATGASAVYDFDKGVLVLEGDQVRLTNADGTVTARKALQYWANERVAVADGDAFAEDREKRRVYADKLVAFFREGAAPEKPTAVSAAARGRGDISYIQGFGNVRVETPQETVRGQRATYNVDTGIVTLDGAVRMTQNNNILAGEYAVVNLRGGRSQVFSTRQGGMTGTRENERVRALIAPSSKPDPVPAKAKP
ncbi:MAG: LptA/OstA family protein [Rhodospirillaceae bacterium]